MKEGARFSGAFGGQDVQRGQELGRRLVLAGQEQGLGAQQRERVVRGEAPRIVVGDGEGGGRVVVLEVVAGEHRAVTPLGGVELGGALQVAQGAVLRKLRAGGIEGGEAWLIAPVGEKLAGFGQFAQVPADEGEEVIGLPGGLLLRGPLKDGDRLRPEREDELGRRRLRAGEQVGVAAQIRQPIEHLRLRRREVKDLGGVGIEPDAVIPGGQLKEGLVRQLVADESGKLFGGRFAAQVSLEAGEVVERVEFEQGGTSSVRARSVAPQPLDAGAYLEGVQVAGVAEETLFGGGQGAVIELLAQVFFGQLCVGGTAPAGRERGEAEGFLGVGLVTQSGAGEAELVVGARVIGVDAQRVAGEA